jgi:hypothetical protein
MEPAEILIEEAQIEVVELTGMTVDGGADHWQDYP